MIDFDGTVLAAADAAFAEQVVWLASAYPSQLVAAIFFDGMMEDRLKDEIIVTERVTRLNLRASNLPRAPREGDRFQVQGRLYDLIEALPDGLGAVSCVLRLTSNLDASRPNLPPVVPVSAIP